MTVASEISRVDPPYAGNGVTTVFPYTFKIFAAGDLRVILTDPEGVETTLVLGVDYTVSGAGSAAGGNVTTTVAPATDYTLSIERVLAPTQPVDLRNQGPFLAEVVERVADRLTMLVQQALAESGSALRLPKGEAATDLTTLLPPIADRKGMALGFDPTTGAPGVYAPLGGATVSAALIDVVQAATRQIAIDLLAGGVTNNRVLRGDGTHVTLGQILLADFANVADARLLGRSAGSAGIPQELTVGAGLSLSAGALTTALPFLARISNAAAIAVTGDATATLDRWHEINLTAADATISLPPVSGNAGKVVGFKVLRTNTKCATIDADGSEYIDNFGVQRMHKGGILLVYCDGTQWQSLIRNLAPGVKVLASSNASQAVTADSENVEYEDQEYDSHDAWSGSVFTAPVDGVYQFCANCGIVGSSGGIHLVLYYQGGALYSSACRSGTANAAVALSAAIPMRAGTTVSFRLTSTETRTADYAKNTLSITRVADHD